MENAAAASCAGTSCSAGVATAGGKVGRLYVVGTPIGNLGDLSPRAVEAFRAADAVCCEDTRVTGKLLAAAGVSRPLVRADENVIARRAPELVERMLAGAVLAFAADAGMPGVSDPGQVLVEAARAAGVPVEVVPGPVACVTALVASGIPSEHFFFEGFLPRKAGERARRLTELASVPGALLFYESPHRVEASLASIAMVFPQREAALCRELTKLHEEVLRAPAPELLEQIRARIQASSPLKGECVIVVAPPSAGELAVWQRALAAATTGSVVPAAPAPAGDEAAATTPALLNAPADPEERLRADISAALAAGEAPSAIAKRLSQAYSRRRREVYALVLELQA